MKGTIKILDATGHTTVEYDTEADVVGEATAILALAARRGSAVFDAKTREQVPNDEHVLSEHDELLVIPPMAGGR
jgi:molybdopterin converting factor small subunit